MFGQAWRHPTDHDYSTPRPEGNFVKPPQRVVSQFLRRRNIIRSECQAGVVALPCTTPSLPGVGEVSNWRIFQPELESHRVFGAGFDYCRASPPEIIAGNRRDRGAGFRYPIPGRRGSRYRDVGKDF